MRTYLWIYHVIDELICVIFQAKHNVQVVINKCYDITITDSGACNNFGAKPIMFRHANNAEQLRDVHQNDEQMQTILSDETKSNNTMINNETTSSVPEQNRWLSDINSPSTVLTTTVQLDRNKSKFLHTSKQSTNAMNSSNLPLTTGMKLRQIIIFGILSIRKHR